jgi:hypothetical protein
MEPKEVLGLPTPIAPIRTTRWSEPGQWREQPGRWLPVKLPTLRCRRNLGPLSPADIVHQRLLATLEDTDFFDATSVSNALDLEIPISSSDHVIATIEVEAPIRVAECRLIGAADTSIIRTSLYASEEIDQHKLRCYVKVVPEKTASAAVLVATADRDNHGWMKLTMDTPGRAESESAIVRVGYDALSLLLPERPILRPPPAAMPTGSGSKPDRSADRDRQSRHDRETPTRGRRGRPRAGWGRAPRP